MWDGIEKRRFPRAEYPCHVRIKRPARKGILGKKTLEEFATHTENIGLGGICVLLPKEIKLFSSVEVELELGHPGLWISSKGTIVWCVKKVSLQDKLNFDTGIEFVDLGETDRLRIEKIIQESSSKRNPL